MAAGEQPMKMPTEGPQAKMPDVCEEQVGGRGSWRRQARAGEERAERAGPCRRREGLGFCELRARWDENRDVSRFRCSHAPSGGCGGNRLLRQEGAGKGRGTDLVEAVVQSV